MLLIANAQQTDKPEYDRRKRMGAGPPSDVWALGCLLFELVTGEFLQFERDWIRFFLRVTTDTMAIVDNEKQRHEHWQCIRVASEMWRRLDYSRVAARVLFTICYSSFLFGDICGALT